MKETEIYLLKDTEENKHRLIEFLFQINHIFEVPLSENIKIGEYVDKIINSSIIHVAVVGNEIVGVIIGYANDFENKNAHISILGVSENFRGRRIGTKLLNAMIHTSKNLGMESIDLFTHVNNSDAVSFYESNGFTKTEFEPSRNNEYHLKLTLIKNRFLEVEKEAILITAIGSFAADIAIESYKNLGYKVIGTDIYNKEWLANALEVDKFFKVPKVLENDVAYVNNLLEICQTEKVKFLVPLTDFEVDVLSEYKNKFLCEGIIICTPDKETVDLCRDKYRLPKYLEEKNINITIPTFFLEDIKDNDYPVFVKPRFGRSSIDTKLVHHKQELKEISMENNGYLIVQPYIKGSVITVDVLRTKENEIRTIARRELLRTSSGAGTTIKIMKNDYIEEMCKKIAETVKFVGVVNIEFIERDDGNYSLLEINPRFSGGIAFSTLAGYNFPKNHLYCFQDAKIDYMQKYDEVIITRKYVEVITK